MKMASVLGSVSVLGLATGAVFAEELPVYAQATSVENDKLIEEVIVTGEKIARSLQDTPTSVAVLNDIKLSEQNIIDLNDAFDRIANVSSSFGGSSFTIRGISNLNVSGGGQGDLATVYIDGSPLPRNATLSGPFDIWDVSGVEVFRGPQSTLQGRNTLAGAVIVNTANPTYEWTGRVRAIASTAAEEKRLGVALGGPIIDSQLAFRVAAEVTDTDGLVQNPTRGEFADARDSVFLRAKLLVEPAAAPDLSVLLSYTRDEREFGDATALVDVVDGFENRQIFSNRQGLDNAYADIGVATINYDFSDALALTSISAVNVVRRERQTDGDLTAEDLEFSISESEATTYTQELRLEVNTQRLTGVIGGYYAKLDIPDEVLNTTIGVDLVNDLGLVNTLVGGFGLDVPTANFVASFYADPLLVQSVSRNPTETETVAIFADFNYQLTDDLRLIGGFRYDSEKQDIGTGSEVSIVSTLPNPADFAPQLAPLIAGVNGFAQAQALAANTDPIALSSPSFGAFLPKLGISWDIADERSLSFTAQRGYRSGGVGVNQARATTFQFDQEFIWNYELAWRSRWLDGALTLNANAFYIDWSDQQVTVQLSSNVFDFETQNAGSSRVLGFELESSYIISENLEVYGSVGFSDTRFNDFNVQIGSEVTDFSGNEFPDSPRWTLAGGLTWHNDDGLFLNLNGNYRTATFPLASVTQTERVLSARFLLNFKLGWENENFGVYITGDNVLDDAHIERLFPFAPDVANVPALFTNFGEAQTFSLQLEAKF